MQFFQRLFQQPKPVIKLSAAPPAAPGEIRPERRLVPRYVVHPKFPLKAALTILGPETKGVRVANSRIGWDWKGRLVCFSTLGAGMQMLEAAKAATGDACELKLSLGDAVLVIPCHITNVRVQAGGLFYGLKHDITDPVTRAAYQELFDIVALGARLEPVLKRTKPDHSGYLVEQYASDRQSRLTVWRHQSDGTVAAVEFMLRDGRVQVAEGHAVKYQGGADAATARKATPEKRAEIEHLFHWVVPNLAACVPEDVREFLEKHAV
ncbi:MAG: hypothetical protein PSW75_00205 [bacterium]|nr:hypothetical protein [bacterium]MDI1336544.1 hypothetical protein [Lacunisphaera sp.]